MSGKKIQHTLNYGIFGSFTTSREKNGEDESQMENNVEMVTSINILRIKCRDNDIINEF